MEEEQNRGSEIRRGLGVHQERNEDLSEAQRDEGTANRYKSNILHPYTYDKTQQTW